MTDEKPIETTAEEVGSQDVVPDADPPIELTAEDVKPPEAELAVRADIAEVDVYRAFDRTDEILILDEMMGQASALLDVMVYSFGEGSKRVTDLSVGGVNEAVRLLNDRMGHRIRVAAREPLVSEVVEEGKTYYRVMVYAEDERTGAGGWGAATEPKHMTLKNQSTVWDKFALTKALNKAERNAKKKLIPESFRQSLIALYLEDESRVRRLQAVTGGDPKAILPPPAQGEEADRLREEARAIYLEIQKIDRAKITPGRFDALFTNATSAEETLRAFVKWLRDQLEEVGGEMPETTEEAESDG